MKKKSDAKYEHTLLFWLCLLHWNSSHADRLISSHFYFSLSPLHEEKRGRGERERERERGKKGRGRESIRSK